MITSFPGHRDPGCPGFRCPQPEQVCLQMPRPSSSSGASRRTTSARIKSPSVGHLAVRSGLEPTQLINQSYIISLPKGHAHLNGIPYGSPRSATMRSVAANGADRATVAHGNCCFILSQMAVVVSEKREGPAQSTLKQKDQSIKGAPKGSAPQRR